ncbi:MAG: hypothetical protein HC902_08020 [Calothrix sp. SM1_5_4]|nr:hypothetical protein [Calothrix sp. SM1_5_4]
MSDPNNNPYLPNPSAEEDQTERIREHKDLTVPVPASSRERNSDAEERVRASVGRFGAFRTSGAPTATEAALAQSESLRIAQGRILELEQEIERLRLQNEQLGAAGETLRRRADELLADNSRRESDYRHALSAFEQEREILAAAKDALQRDMEQLRRKKRGA